MSVVSGTYVRLRARRFRDGCFGCFFNLRRLRRSRRRLECFFRAPLERFFRGFAQTFARLVGFFRSCWFRIGTRRRFLRATRRAGGGRARPSRCLFRAGIGRLWGVTGGDVPVPGDVPGDGGEAARRFGCSTAREAMPASARRAGVTGVGVGGGRVSESLRGLSRTRGSCRRNVGRRVGNGGRRRTLGVDAAAHDLRRAHDTTRSTPSEEEGVQGPAPRARECFVANSALTIQSINNHVLGTYKAGSGKNSQKARFHRLIRRASGSDFPPDVQRGTRFLTFRMTDDAYDYRRFCALLRAGETRYLSTCPPDCVVEARWIARAV